MIRLVIQNEYIPDPLFFVNLCPFQALEVRDGAVTVNAACKLCKICIREGPAGAALLEDTEDGDTEEDGERAARVLDKSSWRGLAVYADRQGGSIHPVSFELLGKARELADTVGHPVYALCIGSDIGRLSEELAYYGADAVFVYDDPAFSSFRGETYAAAFVDFARQVKPSSILVGGTVTGRQLAPRVAARLRTGLTADCTALEMRDNTDLVQIRPAFGGNIMAEIITPDHRPQMATVRYKIMEAPVRGRKRGGKIIHCTLRPEQLVSGTEVLRVTANEPEVSIEAAEVLVVAGRGIRKREDLRMLAQLADLLGGLLACTRPLAESGWMEPGRQIGLSGRTVRPKLIITCGVSGAVQFSAGMNASEWIIAINKDEKAPVMQIAHIAMVGDLYEIVPRLIDRIEHTQGGLIHAVSKNKDR